MYHKWTRTTTESSLIELGNIDVRAKVQTLTDRQFVLYCKALWGVSDCVQCPASGSCENKHCDIRRILRYKLFRRSLNRSLEEWLIWQPQHAEEENPIPQTFEHLATVVGELQQRPDMPRSSVLEKICAVLGASSATQPSLISLTDIAIQGILFTRTLPLFSSSSVAEVASHPRLWRKGSLASFTRSFLQLPTCKTPSESKIMLFANPRQNPGAYRLVHRARLRIQGTDDIRDHLRLEKETNTVFTYRQAATLKEHLRLSKPAPGFDTWVSSRQKISRILRPLMLETLLSMQTILFHFHDDKSVKILNELCDKGDLDDEYRVRDLDDYCTPEERNLDFRIWSLRLDDLKDELENPRPQGRLEAWLETRSSARYTMIATLVSVTVALLLGLLAVGIAAGQTWIAWQQWQHPIQP